MTPAEVRAVRERLWPAATVSGSRDAMAAALGVSVRAVVGWEYGERRMPAPTVRLLELLAREREAAA